MDKNKNGKARTTIEVVIVDDHPIIRCGLRGLLSGDHVLKVVGEADTGAKAIALISQLRPDVALVDISLGLMSGIDVIRCAKQLYPATKILVLTAYDDVQYVRSMIKLGVNGYLLKTVSGDELRRAILYVAEGGLIFQPQIACKALSIFESRSDVLSGSREALTPRENEVLTHIAQGLRDKEIASLMGIVPKTVEVHVGNILAKLGVQNRTQAALKGSTSPRIMSNVIAASKDKRIEAFSTGWASGSN